jgi:hypothetical protein
LRHDFIAEIQCVTGNARLSGVDKKPHESRRAGRVAVQFFQFGNLIELPLRGLLVGLTKEDRFDEQYRRAEPATPAHRIGRVAQLGVADIVSALAAKILLSDEAGGTERLAMVRVCGREQLADQRQGSFPAAPRLLAASGVAPDRQCSTPGSKIAGVGGLVGYFP